jgi:hypothetical protein
MYHEERKKLPRHFCERSRCSFRQSADPITMSLWELFSLRLSSKRSGVTFFFQFNGLLSNEKEYVTLLYTSYPSVMLDFFSYVANVTLIYTIKENI